MPTPARAVLRFRNCTLDPAAYELRRDGRPVRIERQPMDLLLLLVERHGQLVTHTEIAERLWGQDVFVEVETGIHTAIRKIRLALRDSAETPTFLETVAGRGYRFIAPVETTMPGAASPLPAAIAEAPPARAAPSEHVAPSSSRRSQASWWFMLTAVGLVLAALGTLFWSPREPARTRIAVLPFATLSGPAELAPIADGLTEETIATLGQADPEHLAVVGRTSMLAYRGTTKSLADIGRELDATHLVESSLRSEGTRLRVTARLVRAADQVQLWSQSFDRDPSRLLEMQQELSRAIVEQVRLRVTSERATALARRHPPDPAAYDAYLRGLSFASRRSPDANAQAVELFTLATTLDGGYALAWSGLARVQAASLVNGDASPAAVGPRVRDAAARALAADPQLAEAVFASAYLHWTLEWDWPEAERRIRRAIELDPQFVDSTRTLGHVLSQMGRHDEAATLMAQARAIEPLDAMTHALSSQVAFQGRRHEEALQHGARAVALAPSLWVGYMMRAQAEAALGRAGAALEALDDAERLSGRNSKAVSLRAYVLGTSGQATEAREVLAALEDTAQRRYVPAVALALAHAGLGDMAQVFAWLERAVDTRDVHLIYLTVDPKWDPLRDDPRFAAILQRCGFVR